jgi:hypothetical protein
VFSKALYVYGYGSWHVTALVAYWFDLRLYSELDGYPLGLDEDRLIVLDTML